MKAEWVKRQGAANKEQKRRPVLVPESDSVGASLGLSHRKLTGYRISMTTGSAKLTLTAVGFVGGRWAKRPSEQAVTARSLEHLAFFVEPECLGADKVIFNA